MYTQVLMLTPSPGSKWYEDTYTEGLAFESVDGIPVDAAHQSTATTSSPRSTRAHG